MADQRERQIVNRALMSNGFGRLDDPGLIKQLGFVASRAVSSHEDFRALIGRCEPEKRPAMYDALKPYIRFPLKPLDVYIAESHELAERKQLPTLDADGKLLPFRIPEIRSKPAPTDLEVAQRVINDSLARVALTVNCARCTREDTYTGMRREDAVKALRAAGWRAAVTETDELPAVEICPKCYGKH